MRRCCACMHGPVPREIQGHLEDLYGNGSVADAHLDHHRCSARRGAHLAGAPAGFGVSILILMRCLSKRQEGPVKTKAVYIALG